MNTKLAQQVLNAYRPLLEINLLQCDQIGRNIPIPTFDIEIIAQILNSAQSIFEKQDLVLELQAPMYVIGDLHGNIFDLIRLLNYTTMPPHSNLLFLGDYVDRGEYSIDVIVLLFSLLIIYPDYVHLIRGNHEFEEMNFTYGFFNEVDTRYKSRELYDKFNSVFQYMPLAAILNKKIFCVHGGISPTLQSIQQISKIKRPLENYEGEYVADLVWSDPTKEVKNYDESKRGLGVQFGVSALKQFLEKFHFEKVLRAHQCVFQGISIFGDGLLYTVFSSSNYAEENNNSCGLLFLKPSLRIEIFSLPMLLQVPRKEVNFKHYDCFEPLQLTAGDSLSLHLGMLKHSKERFSLRTSGGLNHPLGQRSKSVSFFGSPDPKRPKPIRPIQRSLRPSELPPINS